MKNYLAALRLFNRDVRLYLITAVLIGLTTFGGIYNALLNLFLLRLGYGPEFIGIVNAANLLGIALFSFPSGLLGDRFGARRTMIAGLCLAVVGYGFLPLGEFIPSDWQASWLLITSGLSGLGFALYFVNAAPFLMSITTPAERNYAFSVQTALWPLAGFVGSLIGGFLPGFFAWALGVTLDEPLPFRYPLIIAAALLIPAILAMLATEDRETNPETQPTENEAAADKGSLSTVYGLIAILTLVGLLRVAGEGVARTFLNVYLDDALQVPPAQIGLLLGVGQLLAVPAALVTPVLAARWGNARLIFYGTLGVSVCLLPLAFSSHWTAAAASFMSAIALVSIARPAYMVFTQEIVPPAWRATMSGATTMAVGLSWALVALGGGYVITGYGYTALFLMGAGLTALGAVIFWAYFRVPRGELKFRGAIN